MMLFPVLCGLKTNQFAYSGKYASACIRICPENKFYLNSTKKKMEGVIEKSVC